MKNVLHAYEKISALYDEGTLSKSDGRKWFAYFCAVNFNVEYESRSARPVAQKTDEILDKMQQDKHIGTKLGIDNKTVLSHLNKVGNEKKLDV